MDEERREMRIGVPALTVALVVGCSGPAGTGGAGGSVAAGAAANGGASAGAPSEPASGGTSTVVGSAGNTAGEPNPDYHQDVDCSQGAVCNGVCLAPGESASGCTFVGDLGAVVLEADERYLYSVWFSALYKIDPVAGTEQALQDDFSGASFEEIQVGANAVYAFPTNSGDLVAFDKETFAPTVLASLDDPQHVHLMGDLFYFRDGDFVRGPIVSLPITGGEPTVVVQPDSSDGSLALHVDSTHLYWIEKDGSEFTSLSSPLKRAPIADPSAREDLANPVTVSLVGNSTHLFWATETGVFALAKSGGAPVEIYHTETEIYGVPRAHERGVFVNEAGPDDVGDVSYQHRLLLVSPAGNVQRVASVVGTDVVVQGTTVFVQAINRGIFSAPLP